MEIYYDFISFKVENNIYFTVSKITIKPKA
jgi:hypothetical protein